MIVLDTNVVSELFTPVPEPCVLDWVGDLDGEVALTTVTIAELLAGVGRLPGGRRKSLLGSAIRELLQTYRETRAILPFDDEAAREYAEVFVAREQRGRPISMADAQIAAICRAHGARLATRNVKDFTHTGIGLIDPWAGPEGPVDRPTP